MKNKGTLAADQIAFEGVPSKITEAVRWIVVHYPGDMKPITKNCGKWLLFVSPKHVDEAWETIKAAVLAGKLWEQAKVSTAFSSKGKAHVICVYTYDYEDKEDVMRLREVLRELGCVKKIPYKTDATTLEGDRTSLYYE